MNRVKLFCFATGALLSVNSFLTGCSPTESVPTTDSAAPVPAPVVQARPADPDAPILRVGIISDSQSYPQPHRGYERTKMAFQMLKKLGIDVLLHAGDLTDNGNPVVYQEYLSLFKQIFDDQKPEQLLVMGNHDYWYKNADNQRISTAEAQKNFCQAFGYDSANNVLKVKGYTFIGLSSENSESHGSYLAASQKFFDDAFDQAVKTAPNLPVFVVTHQHAKNTVYGSDLWGNAALTKLFAKHQQLVHFSGHSHYPLIDERSISQTDFTAIGTSSLNYCEMERGKEWGSVPAQAELMSELLYMEIYADKIKIRRFQVLLNQEIKPETPWILPLPLQADNFIYTDKRAQNRPTPVFAPDAKLTVKAEQEPFENVCLQLPQATSADFVHGYQVEIAQKSRRKFVTVKTLQFFSDFYKGKMAPDITLRVNNKYLNAHTSYQFTVRAVDSWGNLSKEALSAIFKTGDKAVQKPKK